MPTEELTDMVTVLAKTAKELVGAITTTQQNYTDLIQANVKLQFLIEELRSDYQTREEAYRKELHNAKAMYNEEKAAHDKTRERYDNLFMEHSKVTSAILKQTELPMTEVNINSTKTKK